MNEIQIIDCGAGNLWGLRNAIGKIGARSKIIEDGSQLTSNSPIILPGVGSFASAMTKLAEANLVDALHLCYKKGTAILGICLGMQLLFDSGDEVVESKGLGFIGGKVTAIENLTELDSCQKIPITGWYKIKNSSTSYSSQIKNNPIYDFYEDYFYFMHSFTCNPMDRDLILATSSELGLVAAVKKENVVGVQFHPEKSGQRGLELLRKLLET